MTGRGGGLKLLGLPCIFKAKTGSHFMYGTVTDEMRFEVPVRRPFSCLQREPRVIFFVVFAQQARLPRDLRGMVA